MTVLMSDGRFRQAQAAMARRGYALREQAYAYMPHGAALAIMGCRDPEVLIEGPAGTGKSRAILQKLDFCCRKYPAIRVLMLRQVRATLSSTVLVTFEQHVLHPADPIKEGASRAHRYSYVYPNGSEIVIAGLDKPSKAMSSEYDMIAIFEAVETKRDAVVTLIGTRLRNNRMPYQQAIYDCNPDQPFHWLNVLASEPDPERPGHTVITRFCSRHTDNPRLYNRETQAWTEQGEQYMSKLRRLTGSLRLRLLEGKWAAAEGAVYEEQWDPAVNLVKTLPDPRRIAYYLVSMDWGFTNPGVLQVWGVDMDDVAYLIYEVYRSQRTMPWWIDRLNEVAVRWPAWDKRVTADPAESDHIAMVNKAGFRCTEANNDVVPGINAVRDRMADKGNGKAGLYLYALANEQIDEELREASKPWSSQMEMGVYAYPKGQDGKPIKEKPVKVFDHGMDAMRYAVMEMRTRSAVRSSQIRVIRTSRDAVLRRPSLDRRSGYQHRLGRR
jgi:phage terminase large subunit